jgi:hypothetical protein
MSTKPGVKVLLTGLSNTGKTNALRTLDPKKTLVVSIDGKTFPFPIPHFNVISFPHIDGFISGYDTADGHVDGIVDKMLKFQEAFGSYPDTVVVDTVSRVFHIIADNSNLQFKNFDIHTNIAKEIALFNNFLQEQLVVNGINVVQISHVVYDEKLNLYTDASSGSYKKAGGVIGTHDHVSFFHVKNKKYLVTHRSPGLPCRTLLTEAQLPSEQSADDYSLAEHIKILQTSNSEITKFTL